MVTVDVVAVSGLVKCVPGPVSDDGSGSLRNGSIEVTNFGSSIGLRVFSSCGSALPCESSAATIAFSSPLPEDFVGSYVHQVNSVAGSLGYGHTPVVGLDEQPQKGRHLEGLLGLGESSSGWVFAVS